MSAIAPPASVCGRSSANSSPPTRNAASVCADRDADERADLGEELVADGVAAGVVDALELVDVDQHERERRAVAARALDHPGDGLLERAVVAEAGEAVAQRRLAGALVQLAEARARGLQLARRAAGSGGPSRS